MYGRLVPMHGRRFSMCGMFVTWVRQSRLDDWEDLLGGREARPNDRECRKRRHAKSRNEREERAVFREPPLKGRRLSSSGRDFGRRLP